MHYGLDGSNLYVRSDPTRIDEMEIRDNNYQVCNV